MLYCSGVRGLKQASLAVKNEPCFVRDHEKQCRLCSSSYVGESTKGTADKHAARP